MHLYIKVYIYSVSMGVHAYPDASGGKRVTTFPFLAPGNSTNLPTSDCMPLTTPGPSYQ